MRFKFIFLIQLLLLFGCTDNPFFSDEIKQDEKLSFKGIVRLPDTNDHSGTMVYLEGFDIFTETDEEGNFKIDLNLVPQLQPGQGLTGFYNVYYYVSNYKIEHSTIFIKEGEFVPNVADLNDKGEIHHRIFLKKLLDVKIFVDPELISEDYAGNLIINVHLENKIDSVIVFSHIEDKKLGSAYLKRRTGQGANIYMLINNSISYNVITIDTAQLWTMNIPWKEVSKKIDLGSYDVIPYLHVYQEEIPRALLRKIGVDVTFFSPDYLKVPFRRQIAELNVEQNLQKKAAK